MAAGICGGGEWRRVASMAHAPRLLSKSVLEAGAAPAPADGYLARALFRSVVRASRRIGPADRLVVREPLDAARWGQPGAWSRHSGESERVMRMLLPHMPVGMPQEATFTRASLVAYAKENFEHVLDRGQKSRESAAARHGASWWSQNAANARKPVDEEDDRRQRLDYALTALRVLSSQLSLAERTRRSGGTQECNGIVVETAVTPHTDGVAAASPSGSADPDPGVFRYCYRVRVENHGTSSVRLVGRHWKFRTKDGALASTVPRWGKGVVGMEPVLEPGDAYEYYSGLTLPTREGTLEGALLFLGPSDEPAQLSKLRLPTQDVMSSGTVHVPGTNTFEVPVDQLELK